MLSIFRRDFDAATIYESASSFSPIFAFDYSCRLLTSRRFFLPSAALMPAAALPCRLLAHDADTITIRLVRMLLPSCYYIADD